MKQKTSPYGDFPAFSEEEQKKVEEVLEPGAQGFASQNLSVLEIFTHFQQNRAERLGNELKQLKTVLGADHPRVLAAERLAKSSAERRASLDSEFQRIQRLPKLKPNEWSVSGRVLDQAGKPAAGLTVNVLDRDRKYDDLLGEDTTDEQGDFNVIYHERDFKEMGENLPELFVIVKDAAGNELFTSRGNVRYNAGRVEYFLIRLGEKPATLKKAKTRKS
jgi:hypothetical protein